MTDGRVVRVSGPLVEIEGLPEVTMAEIVELGPQRLPAEVVALQDGVTTAQAYEYTGGLAPGTGAVPVGQPLAAPLGPALLGGVHDGLLRPLSDAPVWLRPAPLVSPQPTRTWDLEPRVARGDAVQPGDLVATLALPGGLEFRVLVPPDGGGRVDDVVGPGAYDAAAVIATVDGTPVPLTQLWPVRRRRPTRERLDSGEPLVTGQRVLDLLYPVSLGSSAAVPGGFGTGKTMLLQQVAKWSTADVIVYIGCGERGNEMADVVSDLAELPDPRTGGRLMDRTVVIANTSNMPMMAREASIYAGVTVAEFFRDMGYAAVVIADSTSRWAEALRELASRRGAMPAEEGYPAELASALAAFYERAGRATTLGGREGSVTVLGAVSPAGGDLTEPVTANTQRFVRCLWSLDRDLAYARHYPAVSWTDSYSRDADPVAAWHARAGDPAWQRRRSRVMQLLADADRLAALADLVGAGSLPGAERVVLLAGGMLRQGVLQQSALSDVDASSSPQRGAALVDAVLAVVDRCSTLVEQGVPAATLEEVDLRPLLRAREETGPDGVAGIAARRDAVLAELDALGGP